MYEPPHCPSPSCSAHADPLIAGGRFYSHNGEYRPKCRRRPVPRFRCRLCGKGFSQQTFQSDYHDNKPHLNAPLRKLLASGVGLRESARILGLSRRCLQLKARKLRRVGGRAG